MSNNGKTDALTIKIDIPRHIGRRTAGPSVCHFEALWSTLERLTDVVDSWAVESLIESCS